MLPWSGPKYAVASSPGSVPGTTAPRRGFAWPASSPNPMIRDGSLRHAARERGATVLLYEGGENLRFDDYAIDAGVAGVRRVLAVLDMIDPYPDPDHEPSVECRASGWVRARRTGILDLDAHLGQQVTDGERLGALVDSFGRTLRLVHANRTGIVIGRTEAPLVNSGDAVVHIAN